MEPMGLDKAWPCMVQGSRVRVGTQLSQGCDVVEMVVWQGGEMCGLRSHRALAWTWRGGGTQGEAKVRAKATEGSRLGLAAG